MIACFYTDGIKRNAGSLTEKEDATGWCYYFGLVEKNWLCKGLGRGFLMNGSVFIGNYDLDKMSIGSLYELQPDGTYYKFEVEYDHKKDS
jgi:hypothetical protein